MAIGVDLFLILLKYLLAKLTGSPVLLADALHSGGDLAVSLLVFLSILINHNFKTHRWLKNAERLAALLISLLLILWSFKFVQGTLYREAREFWVLRGIPLVVAIAGISLALTIAFAMAQFKRRIGDQYDSIAFLAEGKHSYADFLTSFGVWLTLVAGYFGMHIERLMTVLVGIAVLHIGIRLFVEALSPLRNLLSFVSRLFPSRLRSLFRRWRARLISLKPLPFFFREQWILSHKKQLLMGNIGCILLLYIGTGLYIVSPEQTGIELLFGKVAEKTPPGWHLHAPKPFGDVVRVSTGVTARVESGFRTKWYFSGEEPDAYLWEFTHTEGRYRKVPDEAIAMTGDETLIDANFVCYYRIVDPLVYAFYIENPHETLRSLFNHEVHATVGRYTLDMLLTSERGKVQAELVSNMRRAVARLPLGVEILNVYMREAHPPIEVVSSYRAVASARESKAKIIHTANAYLNEKLPHSRGEAVSKVAMAQAEASEKASKADGDTEQFLLKQQIFQQSEAVQRIRLWWNAVESVLRGKTLYIFPKNVKRRFYHSRQPGSGTIPETFRKTSDTNDNPYQQPDRENSAGNMEEKNR